MSDTEHPRLTASLAELSRDPYPFTDELRKRGPVGWVDALDMWWVVSYREVEAVLRDTENFVAGTAQSLLYDTFGEHMLTVDGAEQARQKAPFRTNFTPATVRTTMETKVRVIVDDLIDAVGADEIVDLRAVFASRLPILAILELFGLPSREEACFRRMYDKFEEALSNFRWDERVRADARRGVADFHRVMQRYIDAVREKPSHGLLSHVVSGLTDAALTDEELRRNASIIFFGGISTVEALILNAVYVLGSDAGVRARVEHDSKLIPSLIDETMRWMSPVQSATRHVVKPVMIGNVLLKPGDTVNCMLAAANRDPSVFVNPDVFMLNRPNVKRHLGFAIGSHFCLGSHLAKLEARIAIERLLERAPGFQIAAPGQVQMNGYEFRQPRRLDVFWSRS